MDVFDGDPQSEQGIRIRRGNMKSPEYIISGSEATSTKSVWSDKSRPVKLRLGPWTALISHKNNAERMHSWMIGSGFCCEEMQWIPFQSLSRVSYINGLVQDCSNSTALAMELLQSCTKPSISSSYQIINIGNIKAKVCWMTNIQSCLSQW